MTRTSPALVLRDVERQLLEQRVAAHRMPQQACGHPVYFVRDRCYQQTYAPHYREHNRGSTQDKHQENDRHEQPGNHRGEHHDDNHD
jgi:hypothetical protein